FPLNHGMLCPKGATAYQTVNHPDRLLYPMMRRHGKNSPLERVSWDEALDTIVQRFHAIQSEYGKDAVASYSGSSLTNEKCYLMGKFARVALGTRHTDYNGRLCMSSATGANERSLGLDRAANPVSDMLHAECIFVIGANVGECSPSSPAISGKQETAAASLLWPIPARHRLRAQLIFSYHCALEQTLLCSTVCCT